ncbi:hypothetical protein DLAC_03712 [Tieghemostelium lacteum]|uniref:Uncharacterized protein n=1 Tax=Tieghemostelium lacteum TaxID=361077 RepID=A0A152A0J8_TIELA|nr:hypothetical protein DLAC_03712 [Tieghemostelium lacteum]|eukprot:KYQ99767.1 hypothetical protein DLAC_03712 [Tieghemostelium lacteum]
MPYSNSLCAGAQYGVGYSTLTNYCLSVFESYLGYRLTALGTALTYKYWYSPGKYCPVAYNRTQTYTVGVCNQGGYNTLIDYAEYMYANTSVNPVYPKVAPGQVGTTILWTFYDLTCTNIMGYQYIINGTTVYDSAADESYLYYCVNGSPYRQWCSGHSGCLNPQNATRPWCTQNFNLYLASTTTCV